MAFNENLDRILTERKINKTELSRQLGIGRATLWSYLNGKPHMPADKIEAVAEILGVTVASLFGETDDNDPTLRKKVDKQQREINKIKKQLETIANNLQMKI